MICISPHPQEAATEEGTNARESVCVISQLLPICCGLCDTDVGLLTSVSVYEHLYNRSKIFISFEGSINGKSCESNHELASYFRNSVGKVADFWKDLCVYGALNGSQPDWQPMRSFVSPQVASGAVAFDSTFKPMIPYQVDSAIRTLMTAPESTVPLSAISAASASPSKVILTKKSIQLTVLPHVQTSASRVYVAGQDTPFVPLPGLQELALIWASASNDEKLGKRLNTISVDFELPAAAGHIADNTVALLRDKLVCKELEVYANAHNARMITHVAFFVVYGWLAMLMVSETQEPNLLALTKLLHDFNITPPRHMIRDLARILCDKRNTGEIIVA